MSKTVTLTEEQVAMISDELANSNDADRYYLDDALNEVDDEERAEIEEAIAKRDEIIDLLWDDEIVVTTE